MIMNKADTICQIKNRYCSDYFGCQYIQHRFKVIKCCPKSNEIINKVHHQELENRKNLLSELENEKKR